MTVFIADTRKETLANLKESKKNVHKFATHFRDLFKRGSQTAERDLHNSREKLWETVDVIGHTSEEMAGCASWIVLLGHREVFKEIQSLIEKGVLLVIDRQHYAGQIVDLDQKTAEITEILLGNYQVDPVRNELLKADSLKRLLADIEKLPDGVLQGYIWHAIAGVAAMNQIAFDLIETGKVSRPAKWYK